MGMWPKWGMVFWLSLWLGGALSQPLDLSGTATQRSLGGVAQQWLDTQGSAQIQDVSSASGPAQWVPLLTQERFRLRSGQILWVRFEVSANPLPQAWFLELPYAPVDRLTLYYANGQGGWHTAQAGDRVAVAQRTNAFRHPLLPLAALPDPSLVYWVRLENPHDFAAHLRLVRQDNVLVSDVEAILVLGCYFGLLILGLAVAGAIGRARRDTALLLFSVKLVLLGLAGATLAGIASIYLWPGWPLWNDLAPTALLATGGAAAHGAGHGHATG
jgi:two-component system, sensor histidine kinase LadS